jgi:hypothetical protein
MTIDRKPRRAGGGVAVYKLWITAALLATYAAVLAVAFGSLQRPTPAPPVEAAAPATAPLTRAAPQQPARPVAKARERAPRVRTRSS